MTRGRFVVLEGIDGAGTSTQCVEISRTLRAKGLPIHVTMEPSSGRIGALLREILAGRSEFSRNASMHAEVFALLFAADRIEHFATEIQPALARGEWVLCDRFILSSLAYQGAQLGLRRVAQLNARAQLPDLTLFLEVDMAVAASRRQNRHMAEDFFESDDMQRRTAIWYQKAIAFQKKLGEAIVVIDGNFETQHVTRACVEAIWSLQSQKT